MELLKSTIKHITQNIATQLHSQIRKREDEIKVLISIENYNDPTNHAIQELEEELETIQHHKYNGAQVRSR